MNTLRKQILVAFAAVGFAGAAFAQTAATAPVQEGRHGHAVTAEQRAAHHAERQAKRAERQAARAAKLRADLKLTAQQEPAFAAFLAAGKPAQRPQGQGAAKAGERGQFAALPAPQRMERMIDRQKQRTARMESRLAALNNFYAVLTPEQKKVFDSQAMRGGFGNHHGHGGPGHHGGRGAALQS
ncbi:Spy/CpxP family protein refolding chaperone [Massilia sp. YIM B02769]|uniref:Spy/CpxP family protein refolding chaperone n=1 Tax=Massilia sp. YIM B02769 TaxID=3050129 RepID=UPI0025B6BB1B|nr:Spy/CpxP family protein refolding chaperone [Massilia sp. YIM B02769]MDN4059617.1 Spy/CpxP family protein refolding chaperone [Massilia sp. YIM B02769]